MSDHPHRFTREEAHNLAQYYLVEARDLHEQSGGSSPIPAMRAANAIALSRAFLDLYHTLRNPVEFPMSLL